VGVKRIKAYKNHLRLYREDKTSELIAFKCINALPDIAKQEYLKILYNDTSYTTYTSTKYLDRGAASNILYSLQNAIGRILSSK
jgi:hypothetical protein